MSRSGATTAALLLAALVAGCVMDRPAPVADFSLRSTQASPQEPPDSYVVRRGDTLYSIAFRFGMDYRTLARLNDIEQPYTIYPGQRLRFEPGKASRQAQAESAPGDRVVVAEPLPEDSPARTVSVPEPQSDSSDSDAPERRPERPSEATRQAGGTAPAHAATSNDGPPSKWRWPARGPLLATFSAGDSSRNGIKIGGKAGDDVVASASGVVVYSGSGLIGYGELIIVKHGSSYLTAYGHNRKRLVSEGERVDAGQRIAEMGSTGAPRPMLHFEIRRDGKPVDPLTFLPDR